MFCCVPCCGSNISSEHPVSFFSFPKEPSLRNKWIKSLKLKNYRFISRGKVCSLHFKHSDIKTRYNRGKKVNKRKTQNLTVPRLKSGAVPTLNQNISKNQHLSSSTENALVNSAEMPKLEKVLPENNSVLSTLEETLAAEIKAPKSLTEGGHEGQSQLASTFPNVSVISMQSEGARYFGNVQVTPAVSNIDKNSYHLTLTPVQAQPSDLALYCSAFPSYEAGTSILCGDKRQAPPGFENLEIPHKSTEVSEISSTVQSNSNVADNITISSVVGATSYAHGFKELLPFDITGNTSSCKKSAVEDGITDLDSDDLYFFKSLLPDLRSLPRSKKTYIRLKIQEIIYSQVYNCDGS